MKMNDLISKSINVSAERSGGIFDSKMLAETFMELSGMQGVDDKLIQTLVKGRKDIESLSGKYFRIKKVS